jgi:hypothetical protein
MPIINLRLWRQKMSIAACGIACEVCALYDQKKCPGCAPGTDKEAPAKLKALTEMGYPCPVLECAIKSQVAYCLSCDKFPCDIHYRRGPYKKELLDIFKKLLNR